MNDTERLFLNTTRDLRDRVASQDPYVVLGASGLLRKLLLDDAPLIDQVNRERRLKVRFEVGESGLPPGLPEPVVYSVQDGIDPDTAPPFVTRRTVTRDQLLGYVLAKVAGRSYSLREIVLFEAHVMGGVHAGTPKDDKERALNEIFNHVAVGGHRASLRQLQAIGRVVLKGLEPLRQAIEAG
jgi:hypothetical protein